MYFFHSFIRSRQTSTRVKLVEGRWPGHARFLKIYNIKFIVDIAKVFLLLLYYHAAQVKVS